MPESPLESRNDSLTPDELTKALPGFQIDTLLSSSHIGTIYRGFQTSLEREISVKVLPIIISSNPEMRSAFEANAKKMAPLNHQNLVNVYDFGEINDTLYMITEHVSGNSLYDIAHEKHVDEKEATQLLIGICKGLKYAHSAGIIHKGLTPSNVLISQEGEPKIVNFGISSLIRDELTADPIYSAPEMTSGGGDVDSRADIYSAGIILYELLVGYLPTNPYTPPSLLRESSPVLDDIILRALQPDPADRYSTAGEMAEQLETFLDSLSEPAEQTVQLSTVLTAAPRTTIAPLPVIKLSDAKSNNSRSTIITLLVMAGICYAAYRCYTSLALPEVEGEPKTEYLINDSE